MSTAFSRPSLVWSHIKIKIKNNLHQPGKQSTSQTACLEQRLQKHRPETLLLRHLVNPTHGAEWNRGLKNTHRKGNRKAHEISSSWGKGLVPKTDTGQLKGLLELWQKRKIWAVTQMKLCKTLQLSRVHGGDKEGEVQRNHESRMEGCRQKLGHAPPGNKSKMGLWAKGTLLRGCENHK